MSEKNVIKELSDIKDRALKASAENDREFYDGNLDPDAIAILRQGCFDKVQVLGSVTGGKARFSAKRVEDVVGRVVGVESLGVVAGNRVVDHTLERRVVERDAHIARVAPAANGDGVGRAVALEYEVVAAVSVGDDPVQPGAVGVLAVVELLGVRAVDGRAVDDDAALAIAVVLPALTRT